MSILTSKAGLVFASTLHTAGAIGFLAGLMVYVAWVRGARRGDPHPNLLALAATLSYVSILANLLGGFMRTYQPGHPKFWELFSEPWAMIMVVKHVFLFGGMFCLVYLTEVVAPRIRKAKKPPATTRKESAAVGFTAASILIASILGAISAVTPIGAAEVVPDHEEPLPDGNLTETRTLPFSGTINSLPIAPQTETGSFDVPPGVAHLEATLTWSSTGTVLSLSVTPPSGMQVSGTASGQTVTAETQAPTAGTWAFEIGADQAVNVAWSLEIVLHPFDGADDVHQG